MMISKLDAVAYKNGHLNIRDGHGIVQTYLLNGSGYIWRSYEGQVGVPKTEGTWGDFWKRIVATYEETDHEEKLPWEE